MQSTSCLLGAGCLVMVLGGAAHAELSVCNDTPVNASVAIGYMGGGEWTSEGWWTVAPGACVTIVNDPQPQSYYYWHAVNENGEFASDDYFFCTENDVFTIVGDRDCAARGHDRLGFNEIQIGAQGVSEVRLTATMAPNASAARKTAEPQDTPIDDPTVSPQVSQDASNDVATQPPADAGAKASAGSSSSFAGEVAVSALLDTTPIDFSAIQAALLGEWTQTEDQRLSSRFSLGRFEDFEDGVSGQAGRWRLVAACPSNPGAGIGILKTSETVADTVKCLILQDLQDDSVTLRVSTEDRLISYSR